MTWVISTECSYDPLANLKDTKPRHIEKQIAIAS